MTVNGKTHLDSLNENFVVLLQRLPIYLNHEKFHVLRKGQERFVLVTEAHFRLQIIISNNIKESK